MFEKLSVRLWCTRLRHWEKQYFEIWQSLKILKQKVPHPHCAEWPWRYSSRLYLVLGVLNWSSFLTVYCILFFSQLLMYFLDFPSLLRQEAHLMGAGERNSWKLNAMCPHEFLRSLSSIVPLMCVRNIKKRADALSWVPNLPASQSIITCQPHEEWHTVTPRHTHAFGHSGSSCRNQTWAALTGENEGMKDCADLNFIAQWTHDANIT